MTDVFSLEGLLAADDTQYDTVEAYGGTVRIGSLCSKDMIEWFEESNDKDKGKLGGLRLLVKSIVDANGAHIPEDQREAAIEKFAHKDAKNNGRVIAKILVLNGFNSKTAEERKNVSGEGATAPSPTGLPDILA